MREITITVRGESGSGKSTLAYIIYKLLRRRGFSATLEDENNQLITDERLAACMASLPERTEIKIVTKLIKRRQ